MLFQVDLNCFQNWCYHNDMQLNISKCAIILFSYKKTNILYDYTLFNSAIQQVFIINDLGIYFDVNCSEFSNAHALINYVPILNMLPLFGLLTTLFLYNTWNQYKTLFYISFLLNRPSHSSYGGVL
ncbi:Reverse transcriptase domain-containing protein, partial [Aphis craccivora]